MFLGGRGSIKHERVDIEIVVLCHAHTPQPDMTFGQIS